MESEKEKKDKEQAEAEENSSHQNLWENLIIPPKQT
jgi:hypothetical protein